MVSLLLLFRTALGRTKRLSLCNHRLGSHIGKQLPEGLEHVAAGKVDDHGRN